MPEGLHYANKERIMSAMAAALPPNDECDRKVDRLEERTALMRERFDDLRSEVHRGFAVVDQRFGELRSDLRGEMQRGFAAVDQRFATVDLRFDDLRGEMQRGFAAIDQRFAAVEKRLDDQQARLEKLDAKFNLFFGTLLAAILAQMALQFLR
jgi:hypothetical protein